ncbi:MAG: hypothetical protein ACUVUD_07710 [bacterium]
MRLLVLVVFFVNADGRLFQPDFHFGYRGEPGVEKKFFAALGDRATVNSWLGLDAGIYGNFLENAGLGGYALSGELGLLKAPYLSLRLGFQHEEWADWRCGENRLFLSLRLIELGRVLLGGGVAWRQPVFDSTRFRTPWLFSRSGGEWNLLYEVRWFFVQQSNRELGLFLSNINRHQIFNPQLFPFGVHASYQLAPNWRVAGFCATAVKGLSAGLFSLSPFELGFGVRYER